MAVGEVEEQRPWNQSAIRFSSPRTTTSSDPVPAASNFPEPYSLSSFLVPSPAAAAASHWQQTVQTVSDSPAFPTSASAAPSASGHASSEDSASALDDQATYSEASELLETKQASEVLEMGFSREIVTTVIRLKIVETGKSYTTTDGLLDAVLAYQMAGMESDENQDMKTQKIPKENSQQMNLLQMEDVVGKEGANKKKKIKSRLKSLQSENSSDKNLLKKNSEDSDLCIDGEDNAFSTPFTKSHLVLKEENKKMKSSRLCKICQENEIRIVFLPCGHMVTCRECSLLIEKCTICSKAVKGSIKVFLA